MGSGIFMSRECGCMVLVLCCICESWKGEEKAMVGQAFAKRASFSC